MGGSASYSDEQLRTAIATSRSWRGVLRSLGLRATSASAMRSVRRHAGRLGLDYSHFTGQRRWSDADLADAVRSGSTWTDVAETLGLAGGSSTTALRGHALRLGLSTQHLARERPSRSAEIRVVPDLAHLRRSGSMIAAAWFILRGREVAWPLEPCAYDLLVTDEVGVERVQVKTTTRKRDGSWLVRITHNVGAVTPYGPEDVDSFFILDGDLTCFWIPLQVVGGLGELRLAAYQAFSVGTARSLVEMSSEVP